MAEVMTPVLASAPAPDPLLTTRDVSGLLSVPANTLRTWRHRGYGPRYFLLGGAARYRRSVVLAWLAEQEQATGTGVA